MSKPSFKGEPNPAVIAAMKIGGAYQIYVLGGIQAIGAMALGIETIKPVDLIVVPGNALVAEGKNRPYGRVGIDLFAGPTETMLIADEAVDAEIRATDLLGQAKQGYNIPRVVVTNGRILAQATLAKIDRLEGRRALVTGASSGIGLGCAAALADAGAHFLTPARRIDPLCEAAVAVRAANGAVVALSLDITDLDATTAALSNRAAYGIVVNSAGLPRHSPVLDTTPRDYDEVMAVNPRAAYFRSSSTGKEMKNNEVSGSIISVTSQVGHVGRVDRAAYCASSIGV